MNFYIQNLLILGYQKVLKKTKKNKKSTLKSGLKGTFAFCAPEIFTEFKYSYEGDVYSNGMIVYEIITGEIAFSGMNYFKLLNELSQKHRPKFNFVIPYCYRKLIEKCWNQYTLERPDFDDICKELTKNPDFITKNVDKDEFLDYVEMIQNFQRSDDAKNCFIGKPIIKNIDKEEDNENKQIMNECFINIKNFQKESLITKRSFSKLYKVKEIKTGKIYTAQVSTIKNKSLSDVEIQNISEEINKISRLSNQLLLKFIGFSLFDFKNKPKSVIITQYSINSTLDKIIQLERENDLPQGWNETKKLINIYGIAFGMAYLHSFDIIHRDLKPENIFLDDYLFPKIGDFGLSSRFISADSLSHQSLSGIMLNPIYLAPEILESNEYSKASDVYAFAFIIFELLTNEVPFENITNQNNIFNEVVVKGKRPVIKNEINDCYRELIEKCWSQDAKDRPSFDDILFYLKNNLDLTTCNINKNEYIQYIKFIEESQVRSSNLPQKINESTEFNVKNDVDLAKSFDHVKIDEMSNLNEPDFVSNERDIKTTNLNDNNDTNHQFDEHKQKRKIDEFDDSISDDTNENLSNDEDFEESSNSANEEDSEESSNSASNKNIDSITSGQNENLNEQSNLENDENIDMISNAPNNDSEESSNSVNDKSIDLITSEQNENSNESSNLANNYSVSIEPNKEFKESPHLANNKSIDSTSGNNNIQLISEFISSKNSKDLIAFINQNCDNGTISSVFDQCYNSDKSLFLDLCKEGLSLNNPVAHYKYALYLIFNSSDNELSNYEKARKHLENSMKQGFAPSFFLLARLTYEVFKDSDLAFNIAKEGAEQNDEYSKCLYGYFIAHGIGTEKNHQKGISMILESHSDDLLFHFATDIGIYYINLNENNVNKDEEEMNYNEAFKWFEKAFNIRHSKATINNYGICFLKGIGVQKDIEKAKEIFKLGVNIEDPNSMYQMGFILENTDPIKSFDLYKKAANKGNLFAKLHCLFISGSQDKEQSIEIYKKAADLGDVKSQQILAKKYI